MVVKLDKLNHVSLGDLVSLSQESLVRIQDVHRAEILISDSQDHDADRESGSSDHCGDRLGHIVDHSVGQDGQDCVPEVTLGSGCLDCFTAFDDDWGEVGWAREHQTWERLSVELEEFLRAADFGVDRVPGKREAVGDLVDPCGREATSESKHRDFLVLVIVAQNTQSGLAALFVKV